MTNKIRRIKGIALLLSTLATGCTSINGVLMSREVGRGVDSSAYALGISREQAVKDANKDNNPYVTSKEYTNYLLENIDRFIVKDVTFDEVVKIIGWPTEKDLKLGDKYLAEEFPEEKEKK